MKKIFILFLMIVIITGCSNTSKNDEDKSEDKNEDMTLVDVVEDKLSKMSIDEKIGQMLMVYYYSPKMDSTLKSALNDVKPGGFILFKENITTYEDTLKLIKDIKDTSDIPMFISIDQEGGNVQRLLSLKDKKVSTIPYMYDVGMKNDEELTKSVGKVIGEELRVFGINMDFSPVIDVYSNKNNTVIGRRAFGDNSLVVSNQGVSLANGLLSTNVIPVYKHFPGHGNTSVDSHVDLPIVSKTKEELMNLDLIPFKNAIESGAKAIMVGHLSVPSIDDSNTPASLSKKIVKDLLIDEMGFNGLVITDALNMGALTKNYTKDDIYVKSVLAGCDVLLMPSSSREALSFIKKAVQEGRISEERINESVRKILTLKYEQVNDKYNEYLDVSYLNSEEHQKILEKIN